MHDRTIPTIWSDYSRSPTSTTTTLDSFKRYGLSSDPINTTGLKYDAYSLPRTQVSRIARSMSRPPSTGSEHNIRESSVAPSDFSRRDIPLLRECSVLESEPITSPAAESDSKLSVQEKMQKYQDYYRSLSQAPLRRFQYPESNASSITETTTSPCSTPNNSYSAMNRISQSCERPRPSTLYVCNTSTSHNDTFSKNLGTREATPVTSIKNRVSGVVSPPCILSSRTDSSNASTTNETTMMPKWPTASIKQARPLSISSFRDQSMRAKSMSRIVSPPPVAPVPELRQNLSPTMREVEKVMSPPPEVKEPSRESRAKSVEKITRVLERKSVPRELENAKDSREMTSPDKKNAPRTKTNFLKSLEKKWEKLKHGSSSGSNKSEAGSEHSSPASTPTPFSIRSPASSEANESERGSVTPTNMDDTLENEKIVSESDMLRRAFSPEKKPYSMKMGASTVSYMLGKFRKFEDSTPSSSTISKSGKPPTGAPGKTGRRVQSVYAGAASDSVLMLSQTDGGKSRNYGPGKSMQANFQNNETVLNGNNSETEKCVPTADVSTKTEPNFQQTLPSKKEKQSFIGKFVPMKSTSSSNIVANASAGIQKQTGSATVSGSSFIPRFNKVAPATDNGSKISEVVTTTNNMKWAVPMDMEPTTPGIIVPQNESRAQSPNSNASDSLDSSSACSEKTESSTKGMTTTQDEESVGDRILRRSFYNRFNPHVDKRKNCSVSPSCPTNSAIRQSKSSGSSSTSKKKHEKSNSSKVLNGVVLSDSNNGANVASSSNKEICMTSNKPQSSAAALVLSKYNPNPFFKELINDDFNNKDEIGRKAEYSRRVTSKLSKLLREIEGDIASNSSVPNNGNSESQIANGSYDENKDDAVNLRQRRGKSVCRDVFLCGENGNMIKNG